jgi:hypothetical protein
VQYAFFTAKFIPPAIPAIGWSLYFVTCNTDPKCGDKLGVDAFGFGGEEVPSPQYGKKP